MKVKIKSVTGPVSGITPEQYIIEEARISSPINRSNHNTAPKLIVYLIKKKHWSPFEMVHVNFEISTSRAIGRELLRHVSFRFQEFSQRYASKVEFEEIPMRMATKNNRQSSVLGSALFDLLLLKEIEEHKEKSRKLYLRMLNLGVARECARFVLPECTQTDIVMSGSLRSWIHFLDVRDHDDAQLEIQLIARDIRAELEPLFPNVFEAIRNYHSLV